MYKGGGGGYNIPALWGLKICTPTTLPLENAFWPQMGGGGGGAWGTRFLPGLKQGYSFFAYNWKLPACSGACSLAVVFGSFILLTIGAFLLIVGAFLLTIGALLHTIGAFLLAVGKCF